MTTFSEKKKFVLESGLTLPELKQFISELEEDAAQAEADGITVYKFLGVSEPDPEEGYNRAVDAIERGIVFPQWQCQTITDMMSSRVAFLKQPEK